MALRNALRYFPPHHHATLAPEFAQELRQHGHIYMYRFCPSVRIKAYPIDQYPCRTRQAGAIMLMIMNNLDPAVAQFCLVMHYLSDMTEEQTLVMYSGHPMGLFPSLPCSPRAIITNGMLTLLNAGRRYLGSGDLRGRVLVTSGLGGMSGAQAKAAVIAGCIGVIAEVDEAPIRKRHEQGWLMEMTSSLEHCIKRIREARDSKTPLSLGYHGNIVDLWERLVLEYERTGELLVDLGSDQTSLHNPFSGGYYPVQLSFRQANQLMATNPGQFRAAVQESLQRHVKAIDKLSKVGMFFWDYGNAFLLEAQRAGAKVEKVGGSGGATEFRYPSYVQHIMGDIFSLGFGPFRWVCTSGDPKDLEVTDDIAATILEDIGANVTERVRQQYDDNIRWIREAGKHNMVVGSQARILYSDQRGRVCIALAINQAIADGRVSAPVVISRDHHDVSGTDSPFRETSNVYDGSAFCAGGLGFLFSARGEVMNGGFGLLLDGSEEAAKRASLMLNWDVSNGVARRCWSGNSNAYETMERTMGDQAQLRVTMPFSVQDEHVLDQALQG
ncbi:hypothetical protein CRUP_013639 [Coryphaenoides rupestris]|nr:hypothetical protein CRUP_013639 [Coryphaenoides rupestris]